MHVGLERQKDHHGHRQHQGHLLLMPRHQTPDQIGQKADRPRRVTVPIMLPLLKEKKKADPNPHRNKSRQKEKRMDSLGEISAKIPQQSPESEGS